MPNRFAAGFARPAWVQCRSLNRTGNCTVSRLTRSDEWRALEAQAEIMKNAHLRDLFARDAGRFRSFSAEGGGLLLDWLVPRAAEALRELAEQRSLLALPDQGIDQLGVGY